MASKSKDAVKKDEFATLRERFTRVADMWNDDRQRYKTDMHFLHVDHWPPGVRLQRESDLTNPRLCLEIDQLSQYQRQVINDSDRTVRRSKSGLWIVLPTSKRRRFTTDSAGTGRRRRMPIPVTIWR
jgi:hypothetical protein